MNEMKNIEDFEQYDEVNPQERIEYSGDLQPVIDQITVAYSLAKDADFELLTTGYEDCNVLLTSGNKRYLAKMFASSRKPEEIERYATIIRKAVDEGVHHPNLYSSQQGDIFQSKEGISLALLDFVEGKTFMEMDRIPDDVERLKTLEQAAKIDSLNLHPSFLFDSWAVQNLQPAYNEVKPYLSQEDIVLLDRASSLFATVPQDELPHTFVHGDLTKSNVLLGTDNEIYILDLSVSNWYPRIQELAVIIANLLHNSASSTSIRDVVTSVSEDYRKFGILTDEEVKYLYPYTIGAIAMEFIGGNREKFLKKNNSEETNYWLELGRNGLHHALENEE